MSDKVIYYTETRGNLNGHVLPYTFVNDWTDEKIEAKLAELKKEGYQDLKVGTYEEYEKASQEASLKAYKAYEAQASDAEEFRSMFNILPPQNHCKFDGVEMFNVCEQLGDGLYNFFIRVSDRYFKVVAHRTANKQELATLCYNATAA